MPSTEFFYFNVRVCLLYCNFWRTRCQTHCDWYCTWTKNRYTRLNANVNVILQNYKEYIMWTSGLQTNILNVSTNMISLVFCCKYFQLFSNNVEILFNKLMFCEGWTTLKLNWMHKKSKIAIQSWNKLKERIECSKLSKVYICEDSFGFDQILRTWKSLIQIWIKTKDSNGGWRFNDFSIQKVPSHDHSVN